MTIKPLGDYILIRVSEEDEKNEAGLISKHSAGDRTEAVAVKGVVVDLGSDAVFEGDKGDLVLVAKWEVQKANVGGINYLLSKPENILAKLS